MGKRQEKKAKMLKEKSEREVVSALAEFVKVREVITHNANAMDASIDEAALEGSCLQFQLYRKISTLSVKDTAAALSGSATSASSTTTIRMAMTMITVLPIICVYPFMQRYFVKGIMVGSMKG